jgi:hypothetical protein
VSETVVTLIEVEKTYVEYALRVFGNNKTHAARALGISVRALRHKLTLWGWHHLKGRIPFQRIRQEAIAAQEGHHTYELE